jgi:hypothetical protein
MVLVRSSGVSYFLSLRLLFLLVMVGVGGEYQEGCRQPIYTVEPYEHCDSEAVIDSSLSTCVSS